MGGGAKANDLTCGGSVCLSCTGRMYPLACQQRERLVITVQGQHRDVVSSCTGNLRRCEHRHRYECIQSCTQTHTHTDTHTHKHTHIYIHAQTSPLHIHVHEGNVSSVLSSTVVFSLVVVKCDRILFQIQIFWGGETYCMCNVQEYLPCIHIK